MKKVSFENKIPEDPINLFHKWFYETEEFGTIEEVNAMTVSTIGIDGFPKNRVVLLKSLMKKDLFFTPITTQRKEKQLQKLMFVFHFWPSVERQVIIKGIAEKLQQLNLIIIFRLDQMEANWELLFPTKAK
jgi:pyridoxamine 5'-phosphate oxidase